MVLFRDSNISENSEIARQRGDLARKLGCLIKENGYEIIQKNGQRIYAPPDLKQVPCPPKGCEVFIGKLRRNLYENELIPLFESIGPLYQFRMMLDFTEKTRGYAFATYFTPEHAKRAVEHLNEYEIRPNVRIGVYKSLDNCRLFIGKLPTDKTRIEVLQMLQKYAKGVVDVIMYQQYNNPDLNRGFVFAEFESHRLAAMARRQFTPENLIAWGEPLYVDWADPLPDVDAKLMSKVTILFLKNLPIYYTNDEIKTAISNKVSSQIIKKVHKMNDYGFVHFINRRSAEFALALLHGYVIADCKIEAEWARPKCYSKANRLNKIPDNFCTSVPPNTRRLIQQHIASRKQRNGSSSSNKATSRDGSTTNDFLSDISNGTSTSGECSQDLLQAGNTIQEITDYSYFKGRPLFSSL